MSKKVIYFSVSLLILFPLLANTVYAADPGLVGWWRFNETSGTTVSDSSGNGNNGTLVNGGTWVTGKYDGALQLDGTNQYVNLPSLGQIVSTLNESTFTIWLNWAGGDDWQRFIDLGTGTGNYIYFCAGDNTGALHIAIVAGNGSWDDLIYSDGLPQNEWHHLAVTVSESEAMMVLYLDGEEVANYPNMINSVNDLGTTTNNWFGRSQYDADAYYNGMLDDLRIYNKVLSQKEIMDVYQGVGENQVATKPYPDNKATDVERNVILSWELGEFADTHNVFFGTDLNDVNNATINEPLSTITSIGQVADANSFEPGLLEFGTTYYWRVDEVNAPSTPGTFKGQVWSFTVEPLARKLPYELITVNASNSIPNNDPNETINESGLDPNHPDEHYASIGLWAGNKVDDNDVWIQYDFDKKYKLHEMLVWNYNQSLNKRYGFKDVLIEYSEDGETWSVLPDANYFEIATGKPAYVYNNVVPFDTVAKSVRITALSNHTGKYYGLAEVRFTYIPVRARIPSPQDGATEISVDSQLSWRKGREAVTHTVYIGTDEAAVTAGTAPSYSVNVNSYSLELDLGQTYYWRVDEVNNSMIPSVWESDIWSFSTISSIVIEDFETGYDDSDANAVWATWKDGYYDTANGSVMGNDTGTPYLSDEIYHSGEHSSPMSYYNDSADYSEVTADVLDLPIGTKDWTTGNPEALVIWFLGDVNNAPTDKLYVKLNGQKVEYNGDDTDISRQSWVKWEIGLSEFGINMNNISSITIGLEKTGTQGGTGIIYLDDIQLTLSVEAVDPGTDNLVAKYDMENNVSDSSRNQLDGTVFGDPTYEEGKYGMAMVFDGNDDYVTLPIGQTISTMTSCTISAWIDWSGGDVWQRVFDFGSGTPDNIWFTTMSGETEMRFEIKADDGIASQATATPQFPSGTWEHLACVIDAEKMSMTLYINGGPVATNKNLQYLPKDMGVTTQNRLGRSQYPADPYFSGMIDDFRIYDRALSEGEIQYIYKN